MLSFIANYLIGPALPVFLLFSGLFMNLRLSFLPFTKTGAIAGALTHKAAPGGVSPFRALCVALAGTLGVGNIVGVAVALRAGGPGALFWMWVSAVFSMILKYAETVLALRHRKIRTPDGKILDYSPQNLLKSPNGKLVGGAMYYIRSPFAAILFALLCLATSFTVGNLLQTNAVALSFEEVFGLSPTVTGCLLALLTFVVIVKGISRIAAFCAYVVPLLSLLYILMSLVILLQNAAALPAVLGKIVRSAFSLKAAGGGIGGCLLLKGMRVGFARGLITNEAGCGTAPIAHATAETDSPVRQGFLGIVEVFFDTLVLCTMTGLVILLSIDRYPALDGMALVNAAFGETFGRIAPIFLAIAVFLFVIATLVGWSFYGKSALEYLCPRKSAGFLYCLLFSVAAFFGARGTPSLLWTLSDITCGAMTFLNTGVLLLKSGEIKEETDLYFASEKRERRTERPKKENPQNHARRGKSPSSDFGK